MHKIKLILLFLIISNYIFAQNQANVWYFNDHSGLDFNTGIPEVLIDGQTYYFQGCATISDSMGNLMFYTDGEYVFNKNHEVMLNGSDLFLPGVSGRAVVNWPGKSNLYYVFTAINPQIYTGFYYSLIDMDQDNGLGAVIEKDTPIESGWDVADRIAIVQKENSENIWVITRKFTEDAFASYLVTEDGLNIDPIISIMPDQDANLLRWGYIKISLDKKYLVSSYYSDMQIEVCSFNSLNGSVEYLYTLNTDYDIEGMEFSPDSRFLYISCSTDSELIYQYDVQFIRDKDLFKNSGILVGYAPAMGMQLARDGKIYTCFYKAPPPYHYVSVINNPWIKGSGCSFEQNAVDLSPGTGGFSFPNILLDYL